MDIKRPQPGQPIPSHAKRVFKGVIFDVYQWEQEMFDGTRAIFEKAKRQDSVTILPVLPDGKILLAEQEQPGHPLFVGGLGGRIEENEDVLTAAKRELLEESGYISDNFTLWLALNQIPKTDWAVYVFVARDLRKVGDLNLDPGEKIKLVPVTLEEMINLATDKNVCFREQEIVPELLEAKYNPAKKKEL